MSFLLSDLEIEVKSVKEQPQNHNSSSDDSALIQVCLYGNCKYSYMRMLHIFILHQVNDVGCV